MLFHYLWTYQILLIRIKYDNILREWVGDYNWKLIYRASEHGYSAKSFHECCDDKGPTLVVIKSSGGGSLEVIQLNHGKLFIQMKRYVCCLNDILLLNKWYKKWSLFLHLYLEESSWSRTHSILKNKEQEPLIMTPNMVHYFVIIFLIYVLC